MKAPSSILDFVWSTSKADTAAQCLFKFYMVYVEKVKESSHALILGTAAHDVMAKEIISRNSDVDALITKLDDKGGVDPELYAMASNISGFVDKWKTMSEAKGLEATIEKKYAITKDLKPTGFFDKDAYIRGVYDLWYYHERAKQLYVIDHKTNKQAQGPKYVKDSHQLKLYVFMLTHMFNLDWEQSFVALHFMRFGKIQWATHTREDIESFGKQYFHLLSILEERITKAYETDNWSCDQGFYCKWCAFRGKQCSVK